MRLAVSVAAALLVVLIIISQRSEIDRLREERAASVPMALGSPRDVWRCEEMRGGKWVVCELPTHALRVEAYVNIHRGCC